MKPIITIILLIIILYTFLSRHKVVILEAVTKANHKTETSLVLVFPNSNHKNTKKRRN